MTNNLDAVAVVQEASQLSIELRDAQKLIAKLQADVAYMQNKLLLAEQSLITWGGRVPDDVKRVHGFADDVTSITDGFEHHKINVEAWLKELIDNSLVQCGYIAVINGMSALTDDACAARNWREHSHADVRDVYVKR